MAQFDKKGTLTGGGTSVPVGGAMAATGSVTVGVGDLIVYHSAELSASVVITGVTDNLGGAAYTAISAGTVSTVASRVFWKLADVAGTLITITGAGVASSNDWAAVASVYTGPFRGPTFTSLDVHPAAATDGATPFTCTATGTLSQATELVICTLALTRGQTDVAATSPLILDVTNASTTDNTASSVSASIGSKVVAATTTTTPAFTITVGTVNGGVEFTMSFMPGVEITPAQGNLAFSSFVPGVINPVTISPNQKDLSFTTSVPNRYFSIRSWVSPGAFEPNPIGSSVKLRSYLSPGVFQSIDVTNNVSLSITSSNLNFASSAPDKVLSNNVSISPTSGDLVFSQVALSLSTNYIFYPPRVDLVLTETAIDLVQSFNTNLEILSGNLIVTKSIPDLVWEDGHYLFPNQVDLSFSTSVPDLSVNIFITPSEVDLSLTSSSPDFVVDWFKFPSRVDLTLNQSSPNVIQDIIRNPIEVDLNFSTSAPDYLVTDNRDINPDSKDLIFTTFDPTASTTASGEIQPNRVDLTLETFFPNFSATDNRDLTPNWVDLILSESAPNSIVDWFKQPNRVDLSFSSSVPNLMIRFVIQPISLDLNFSQSTPNLVQTNGDFVSPSEVDLVLSKFAPNLSFSNNLIFNPSRADLSLTTSAPNVLNSGIILGGGTGNWAWQYYWSNLRDLQAPREVKGYMEIWGLSGFGQAEFLESKGGWARVNSLIGYGNIEVGVNASGEGELENLYGVGSVDVGEEGLVKGQISLEVSGFVNVDSFSHGWGEISLFASGKVEYKSNFVNGKAEFGLLNGYGDVIVGNFISGKGNLSLISGKAKVWHDPDEDFLINLPLAA